jgi:glycosyltransferase involved in cell wall biosynthesis
MQKKILLISPDFPPPFIGGSLIWIHSLVSNSKFSFDVLSSNNLVKLDNPNIRVIKSKYICSSNNPSKLNLLLNYIYLVYWCFKEFKKNKYEVVISNPGLVGNCIIFFIGKIFKKKVIGTVYAEEITVPLLGKGLKNRTKVLLLKLFYSYANSFISVCHFAKRILRQNNFKQNIFIIPPIGNLKIKKKFFNKPPIVLSVGRLIKRKGFDKLIIAIVKNKKKISDLKLNIVGSGPEYKNLRKLIKSLNAENYIKIFTEVDKKELESFYKNSHLFVLANSMLKNGDTEGCPVVFIEAMSYMLPVIGGLGGGVDTAIKNGKNGYILNTDKIDLLTNRIYVLLTNLSLVKKMSNESKKKLKTDHNVEKSSNYFDQVIEEIKV